MELQVLLPLTFLDEKKKLTLNRTKLHILNIQPAGLCGVPWVSSGYSINVSLADVSALGESPSQKLMFEYMYRYVKLNTVL